VRRAPVVLACESMVGPINPQNYRVNAKSCAKPARQCNKDETRPASCPYPCIRIVTDSASFNAPPRERFRSIRGGECGKSRKSLQVGRICSTGAPPVQSPTSRSESSAVQVPPIAHKSKGGAIARLPGAPQLCETPRHLCHLRSRISLGSMD
jgi:hypothetical protein